MTTLTDIIMNERSQTPEDRVYGSICTQFKKQTKLVPCWESGQWLPSVRVNSIGREGRSRNAETSTSWSGGCYRLCSLLWESFKGTLMTVHSSVCLPHFSTFTLDIHSKPSLKMYPGQMFLHVLKTIHFLKGQESSNWAIIHTQRRINSPVCNPNEMRTVPTGESHRKSQTGSPKPSLRPRINCSLKLLST